MYLVSVIDRRTGRRVGFLRFRWGTWQEIGFWLDDQGFIDSDFRVSVVFVGENEFRQVPVYSEGRAA